MTGFEPATPRPPGVCATRLRHIPKKKIKKAQNNGLWSGWQDSNLRPPRPKRGAITGLRYTPKKKEKHMFYFVMSLVLGFH